MFLVEKRRPAHNKGCIAAVSGTGMERRRKLEMKLTRRQKLFEKPSAAFRGKPFWAWNGKLDEAELKRQIDVMREMGFGGFFIHSRAGLETEYLGEEWFSLVNACADYGKKKGMEAWLYDEDRWPSGSAGGIVTEDPRYRAMFLEMSLYEKADQVSSQVDENIVAAFALRMKDGVFSEKRRLTEGEHLREGETAALFWTRYSVCNDNYNGFCYLNTMSREAVRKFLEVTHDRYKEKCGGRLGQEILGIFTDEPHRGGAFTDFAEGKQNAVPYTLGLFDKFEKRFGYRLEEELPELFLRRKEGELSKVKWDYFELCQELFLECFAMQIADWCRENNMIFTGHVLQEDSLCAQALMQGSLMRFYEYMDYPGIDLLTEGNRCYWDAKQVDSVARQLNKKRVLSELYGCTGWQMDFESYKNIGDWQALFGINLRCPHLSWYTMRGEAKRDYPASILHQSGWYPEYHYVEDYFSRINVALEDGKADCSLLVLNPIESVWARAYSGAFKWLDAADPEIRRLEEQYKWVFTTLTENRIDFDYGDEDIMARYGRVENGKLMVGACTYTKVLVAGLDTVRGSTLKLLEDFAEAGGKVIFAGDVPAWVDAAISGKAEELAGSCVRIPLEKESLVRLCRSGREIRVDSPGKVQIYARSFEMEDCRMVMVLNMDRENGYSGVKIGLGRGNHLEQWDPRTGRVTESPCCVENGEISLIIDLEAGGERLYRIPKRGRKLPQAEVFRGKRKRNLPDLFPFRLSERNVCVLDRAEVRIEGETEPIAEREVLKADRAVRDVLGLPWRGGEMLQPWYQVKYMDAENRVYGKLTLDYRVSAEILPQKAVLALEELEYIRSIKVNDREIPLRSAGKWLDICFDELSVPDEVWVKGENRICICMDYHSIGGIEAVYLLGNFGVELNGEKPVLTDLPEKLASEDITCQGLPFYSGSIFYRLEGMEEGWSDVTVSDFGGALVKLIGEREETIAFPPYRASVPGLKEIQVVLTRRNTFGPLHQKTKFAEACHPGSFVTEGKDWSEEYVLYEQGLLKKPEIRR